MKCTDLRFSFGFHLYLSQLGSGSESIEVAVFFVHSLVGLVGAVADLFESAFALAPISVGDSHGRHMHCV